MSPQIQETHVPESMTLSPREDDVALLRDEQGRVLATVETWAPDLAN